MSPPCLPVASKNLKAVGTYDVAYTDSFSIVSLTSLPFISPWGFPGGSDSKKKYACNAGDQGLIPG